MVPASKFEVTDSDKYQVYMREQWKGEDAWKQEQRCTICGRERKVKTLPGQNQKSGLYRQRGGEETIAVSCEICPDLLFPLHI